MPTSAPQSAPAAPPATDLEPLPWSTVYELTKFHYDNMPAFIRDRQTCPDPTVPVEVDADQLRFLIAFAGRCIGNGDPTVPRQLEAYRVVSLVPVEFGAALFDVPATS